MTPLTTVEPPAPILQRWHRPTGTRRTCLGCGTTHALETIRSTGAAASWCKDCRVVGGDWDRPRMRRVIDWSGAAPETVATITPIRDDERQAA